MANQPVVELRIHGVGGSPGPSILGLDSAEEALVVAGGPSPVFLGRRRELDPQIAVEGYDWGALTSSSVWQPLWVVLLPFTLMNVAGWALPADAGRARVVRAVVHVASIVLTLTWTVWLAIIFVDLLGFQWLRARLPDSIHLKGTDVTLAASTVGALTGAGAVAFILWFLGYLARRTQERFEQSASEVAAEPEPNWGSNEGLTDRTFFAHSTSARRLLHVHRAAMVAIGVVVVLKTIAAVRDERTVIGLGQVHRYVGVGQFLVLIALFLLAVGGIPRSLWLKHLRPFAAVTLASALTIAFFSGAELFIAKRLKVKYGQELALVDFAMWTVIVWIVTTAVFLLVFRSRGDTLGVDPAVLNNGAPEPAFGERLVGAPPSILKQVKAARGLAQGAHRGADLLVVWAVEAVALSAIGVALRFDREKLFTPSAWEVLEGHSMMSEIAWWALPLVFLGAAAAVRASTSSVKLRRSIGILWDVLTFWPRRFHPLGVRPYSERAVPEFQARIFRHLRDGRSVVVSAHSQGAILAITALSQQPPADVAHLIKSRVALLTYGNPASTLYGSVFGAHFGPAPSVALSERLHSWVNLYRLTDPIGGATFRAGNPPATDDSIATRGAAIAAAVNGGDAIDVEVSDPAEDPFEALLQQPDDDPNPLRSPWINIAGHSHFHCESLYKAAVAAQRNSLVA